MSEEEQNGGKWGDLGKGGRRDDREVKQSVITEMKDTEWGSVLRRNGQLLAELIKKQEKAKGSQCFPFAVHICRQCRQNKGFSGVGGDGEKGVAVVRIGEKWGRRGRKGA